jgi:hypothetical protein
MMMRLPTIRNKEWQQHLTQQQQTLVALEPFLECIAVDTLHE